MALLNQSGEEQVECPLCMEPLEVDDLNFFPCTCGYQICRFCWHRIRTDENGLCPACRKAYPEDPADFKPLSKEEVSKLKAEKRQKDQLRKQKVTENRKYLANVRVVQRNLVFVVGLPLRLADQEVLKKHEYFGKFGKIHKVVINQSTTYAGSQGPSASAYVTYQKADDALRAIQAVNNISVDGRVIKTSLGTTKYCSHFMKNQTCPKPDCMYLHEMGDSEASFTKEEMQQGKHQEYEKKLHDALIAATANSRKPNPSPPTVMTTSSNPTPVPVTNNSKDSWPSLQASPPDPTPFIPTPPTNSISTTNNNNKGETRSYKQNSYSDKNRKKKQSSEEKKLCKETLHLQTQAIDLERIPSTDFDYDNSLPNSCDSPQTTFTEIEKPSSPIQQLVNGDLDTQTIEPLEQYEQNRHRPPSLFEPDNNSFFSSHTFSEKPNNSCGSLTEDWHVNGLTYMPDVLPPVHSTEDWQAAFCNHIQKKEEPDEQHIRNDDDLGFDPFNETQKGFAEMIEKENQIKSRHTYMQHNNGLSNCSKLLDGLRINGTVPPPPGFTSTTNHMNAFSLGVPRTVNKTLPCVQPTITFPQHPPPPVWDWTALDPAIVTSAQHWDLYSAPPPPGFLLRQTLDSKCVNNSWW
nr:PREDICTED: CCR4-NOT transcription complex subunit 4 isoform X2 [Bemisia tabaci]